jgi:hypothetical protein
VPSLSERYTKPLALTTAPASLAAAAAASDWAKAGALKALASKAVVQSREVSDVVMASLISERRLKKVKRRLKKLMQRQGF